MRESSGKEIARKGKGTHLPKEMGAFRGLDYELGVGGSEQGNSNLLWAERSPVET